MGAHLLIREYYACFNERRLADGADLFTFDAVLERPPFGTLKNGGAGFLQIAEIWLKAFPDTQVRIEHVEQRGDTICEVDLICTATHTGDLDLPGYGLVRPQGRPLHMRVAEILEIRGSKITYSSVSYDRTDLVRQMTGKA